MQKVVFFFDAIASRLAQRDHYAHKLTPHLTLTDVAHNGREEGCVEGARVVPESPKRKASGPGVPRALRFGDPEGRSAKARRFDVRRVFGKVSSAENLAAANGAASSTR